MVMVDHQNGYITLYGHFSRLYVTVGQTVKRGDALGKEGSTGRSTGPHLHFEIRKGSSRLNPADFLR
jgi:murein DD-endopeptidase MepM/ murein hydrolase activator NlpD